MSAPMVAVSTKAYFGVAHTRRWVRAVAALGPVAADYGVELAVLPSFPLLESTATMLAGTGVAWGAQNVAASDAGQQTGEVPAGTLAELGCSYIEVGHAERRSLFGEDEATVRAKVGRVVAHSMVPLICVGEPERTEPDNAADYSVAQLADAIRDVPNAPVVVAYEPVWAIGAAQPACPQHVTRVTTALRAALATRGGPSRVLYGGSAAPGTATDLHGAVDGLFVGRFGHDVEALRAVVAEVAEVAAPATTSPDPFTERRSS
ncbi:triose-phosphate isomerase [Mycobacterium sp. 21AC1]|uniref:triose-phosphate isomerase family protein n=1 Tax=[Mycobacterium] appelbergii TaxID=2939269 RepID=UPI00293908F2|nr:triose-phosphate isomerase family protein [Mycobacterium sp. 21AC1]MDV3127357.1 triose-phosphate isomerase [Mycobacterium sp. 21AC1]